MTEESDNLQQSIEQITARFVRASSREMHQIEPRTDSDAVASEVLRLNGSVRQQSSDRGISPYSQPADFQRILLQQADVSQSLGKDGGNEQSAINGGKQARGMSIAQAAKALSEGQTTSEKLTLQALELATARQPELNAFIEIWADKALDAARRLDRERDNGQVRGDLHGIVLAHKDCFEIAGHAATIGSRARPTQPAQQNAWVIERLHSAGAFELGTLNMNEMVAGPTGQNPTFGDCANAIDPSRISGGSSSGSGSAVAAGIVFGSLGSDTGGSIRLPASANGIYGLKPTYGRISRGGCFPRAFSLDCPGPMTRTAQDCAIMLKAVAGFDPDEPSTLKAPVPDYPALINVASEGSRIGLLRLPEGYRSDPDIVAAFEAFAASVERQFGKVIEVDFPNIDACNAMGDIISKVEAATLHGQWMRANPHAYSQAVFSRTEPGLHVPAVRYLEALQLRSNVLMEFLSGPFKDADLLLCPTLAVPVPLRKDADMEAPGSVFGVVAKLTRLTRPLSYLGLPVLSMPVGLDATSMPVGAQVIGRPLSEARILSFAHRISTS